MNPELWRQASEILAAALERVPQERPAFVEQACGADAALRREVESLLLAHDQAESFIETPLFGLPREAEAAGSPDESAARFEPGTRLGPYQVVALLGAGGMGQVWRAHDPRLRREVAIKVLPGRASADRARLRRFEHEARAAGSLNHPNILAVFDIGAQGGAPYVVTELLEGETLQARLQRGPIPLRDCLDQAGQVAAGLAAAHEKGVVHRDLKPANLFLTRDGRVKILDFGLAKLSADSGAGALATGATLEGTVMGTAGYMSPEQVRGQVVDHRSDLFSFGAVLYEMLAGRRAFTGGSVVETMSAILTREPPGLPAARQVPPAVDLLVRRCLRKDRDGRMQSSRELCAALAELLRAVDSGAGSAGPGTPPAREPAPKHTIAVLPFVNLSADPDQDYFCEGMADELINALVRIEGLRVAARVPLSRRHGRSEAIRRLGERMGVDKLLEGSVRKAGERLRITVQLVNVADGFHVWSERYDREMADVFAVQDEIATRVAEALRLRLAATGLAPRAARQTADLEAYHLYLRGRYHWNKRHEGGLQEGVRCFEQAIERDPGYALAYAGLADSYALMGLLIYEVLPPHQAMPRARAAARQALELDPELAEAHACLGWVKLHYDWDWLGSEEDFQRSLALDPERATTHHWYSFLLTALGRFDAATAHARRAWELDPLSLIVNANLVQPSFYARRFDEAIAQARKLVGMEPAFAIGHFWVGVADAATGRHREAIAELRSFSRLGGGALRALSLVAYAQACAGDREEARRSLAELHGLAEGAGGRYVPAYHFAQVHAGLGERDAAFSWLEQALAERCDQLAYLAVDPLFDGLRDDSRFDALLGRLGLAAPVALGGVLERNSAAGPHGAPHPGRRQGERRRAVAVLPFRSLIGDPADANLGLGLADATIAELAGLRSLLVRPTAAILRFAGQLVDPQQAGRELGVDAALDGTFQRAGSRLRVVVQLVAAQDGRSLWAAKIDTSLDDLFAMQDEVSRNIARALAVELAATDAVRPERRREAPAGRALEHYLRGRAYLLRETHDGYLAAVDWFEKARAADPGFGPAWAGIADVCGRIAFNFEPEGGWYARAHAACDEALRLDPSLPEGLYARARLRWSPPGGWDHAGALRDLVAAIAARPNLDEAHLRMGTILYHVGLVEEAMPALDQSLAISPGNALARCNQGFCHYHQGRYGEALRLSEEVARAVPSAWIHYQTALCQLRLGRHDDAAATADEMARQVHGGSLAHPIRGMLAALRGDAAAAREEILATEREKQAFGHYHHPQYEVACILAQLGETAAAVIWLRAAARNGYPCAPLFERDPLLDPLRGDARFAALLDGLQGECAGYARLYDSLQAQASRPA